MVDRFNILSSGMEEVKTVDDKFLTIEVQFYGEVMCMFLICFII